MFDYLQQWMCVMPPDNYGKSDENCGD
jgi:hypothetical protein